MELSISCLGRRCTSGEFNIVRFLIVPLRNGGFAANPGSVVSAGLNAGVSGQGCRSAGFYNEPAR